MGAEMESIEQLPMPRRHNFDALVWRIDTLHVGKDFVEGAQRRFPRRGCQRVQISEIQPVKYPKGTAARSF